MKHALGLLLFVLLLGGRIPAQEIPFLDEAEYDWLVNEISGDLAYEHIRFFTQFHRPRGGSPGLMEVARYVEMKAQEYGLEDVELMLQPSTAVPWSNQYGELWVTAPRLKRLASTLQHPLHLSDFSRTTHLEGVEIVSVGEGVSDSDYEGRDVEGKIVLAYGSPGPVMRQAVWQHKAAGIITYPDPRRPDYPQNSLSRPDHISWTRIPVQSAQGEPGTFGFRLTSRQAVELNNWLAAGEPLLAKVDIESEFGQDKWQVMVQAFIHGTEIEDQDVVLTGHLQEEKFSANDDASGCASVLEIGRALKRLIDAGHIPRPRRNLRLWWVTEISSQRQFFADHPETVDSLLVNINQDMVGADQSQDLLRVQNMTRVPFSRFHFLNDVAERWLEFTIESNQGNLAVLQAGSSAPYPRPILSRLGSRHRYNAHVIPFHNNTDHMPFNEAPVGVPAITFTNWPDNFIHSSDDDLWNIDRTQLQRNAFTVAAIAYTIARAGVGEFPSIASEVEGRAMRRLGDDWRLALKWLDQSPDNIFMARQQLVQAGRRELKAAESLRQLAATPEAAARIERIQERLRGAVSSHLGALSREYKVATGRAPGTEALTEVELELQKITPRIIGSPRDFLEKRGQIGSVAGLHSLMAFEVLNFVDSQHTGLDIYHAVAAEARRAGKLYYGEVTPASVRDYLRKVQQAGLVEF